MLRSDQEDMNLPPELAVGLIVAGSLTGVLLAACWVRSWFDR